MANNIIDSVSKRSRTVGAILAALVYTFLLAPIVVTVPMAFGPTNALSFPPTSYSLDLFRVFFSSPNWVEPLLESAKIALASTVAAVFAGTLAGYWISRHKFVGKGMITGVIMSPLIVPTIVLGLGLYLYFSYMRLAATVAIVLGHIMVTLPYVIIMIVAGVSKLDRNLEFGAELMGAGPIRMFLTVVVPQLVPSLVSAALFAFLLSFDELIISWFLCDSNTVTLPVRMYSALRWEVSPVIAAVSTLLMGLSLIVCVVAIALKKSSAADR